jgi:hypothetical protein
MLAWSDGLVAIELLLRCLNLAKKSCCRQNAAIQPQATFQKARTRAPSQLHFKAPNCDGFLECRA